MSTLSPDSVFTRGCFRHYSIAIVLGPGYFRLKWHYPPRWIILHQPGYDVRFLEHLFWVTRNERLVRFVSPYFIRIHDDGTITDDIPF
ncbi:MAG: hypothetical protein SAJ12_24110 [Jaaginema sp. PMC 1079.18]|nr:hypothetical protein [Jaaginema sp. PMC 1079.18]MEC4868181.1 hypothetical protein [Jaaginema sp. PMC 1078.18]